MAQPADGKKRVKVYELRANDWHDRGTGFCTGLYQNEEASIHVQSEEEPEKTLLQTKIKKNGGYQKQQDTLIVWTEPEPDGGMDMALSFQEAEGCGQIWEFVNDIQQRLGVVPTEIGRESEYPDRQRDALNEYAIDEGLVDDVAETAQAIMLPPPELSNLPDIEAMLRAANTSNPGREALTRFVVQSDYIRKLVPLVEMAEDLESLTDLHRLCNIMKTLILLNDTAIIEHIVSDEMILGVVGALEYDPDFPSHKANHRQYLADESRYKEVVKIDHPDIVKKIHQTYRLQYLKDVVLARIIDDPTFSVLSSLIYYYQIDIVGHIQSNGAFLQELFSIFHSDASMQRKKDAVLFIQSCCVVSKQLQPAMKNNLFTNFLSNGLFGVIIFALRHPDPAVRVAGIDILIILIEHDAVLVRAHLFKSITDKTKPLTDTLIELLLVEVDLGVKSQEADAIKVLLDPMQNLACVEALNRTNNEGLKSLRNGVTSAPQQEKAITDFFVASCRKLFKPLMELVNRESMQDLPVQEVMLYVHLVEILSYFARQHTYKSQSFMVEDDLSSRVAQLLASPEKHLKLSALKYFRCCISLHDEFHNRQMIDHKLFDPILKVVFETMPRDNLLNSACLDIFEAIKREHVKPLILHLVENYRDKLEEITYVETFTQIITKYDQLMEPHPEVDHSFTSADTETPNRIVRNGLGAWQGLKEDMDEESYFNDDDDDEDGLPEADAAVKPIANGASPLKALVNYPDDDDEDSMDILASGEVTIPSSRSKDGEDRKSSPTLPSTPDSEISVPQTPPERISEKRRREEDEEEDPLSALASQTKRRNSFNTATNENTPPQKTPALRRKSSMKTGKDGPRISIALAVKSGGDGQGGDHE